MTYDYPKILHVDDEPDCLTIAKIALENIGGLEVVQCSSGRRAIELAKISAPDLILLDVMMPGIDGVETLRWLREIPEMQSIPVIFVTAKVMPEDHDQLIEAGAACVIKKPFDAMTFASEVMAIWRDVFQARMIDKLRPN